MPVFATHACQQSAGSLLSRARLLSLAVVLLMLPMPAPAQEGTRIGYVDMIRLFDGAPQLIAAREALDREFRPRNEALVADESRLEQLAGQMLASDEGSEQRQTLEREVRNLRRSIERRREDLAEELRFRTNAEKKNIEDTIEVAIRQVARSGQFDLILTSPVAFASDRVDITDRILEWLEDDFNSQASNDLSGNPQ